MDSLMPRIGSTFMLRDRTLQFEIQTVHLVIIYMIIQLPVMCFSLQILMQVQANEWMGMQVSILNLL